MPGLNRNEEVTCKNCGIQTTKMNIVRHSTRFSAGTFTDLSFTNFSTKSWAKIKYHIAKKHSKATARVVNKSKICDQDFYSLHLLQEQKRKEHGAQRGSGAQIVDVAQLMGDVCDNRLKEELETC